MKKRNKILFGILTPIAITSVATLSCATASFYRDNKIYNQNTKLENEPNLMNINQNSRASGQYSSWNKIFNENYGVSRVFVQANSTLSAFFPFELMPTKIQLIKTFFANNYNNIFAGKMNAPVANDFEIDSQNYTVNNKEGWIDLRVTKKGYFDLDSNWVANGYMPYEIIRITGLKKANPTPTVFKIKQVNGTPLKLQYYASEFVDEFKNLYDSGDKDEFFNFTKKWFDFDSSNFPFSDISNLNLNFSNINNHQGSFLMTASYLSYFADDDYCTFINTTIGASGEVNTEYKGLSEFQSYVIPYNSTPPDPSTGIGIDKFNRLYAKDFLNKFLTEPSAKNWVKKNIFALIKNPSKNATFNNVYLSENEKDYVIDYDKGSITLAGYLDKLYVENGVILDKYDLNTNGIKIIITGLEATLNTKILKNENFPVVDASINTLPTNKPSKVLENLKKDINKPWNDATYAQSFFLPLNLPQNINNFKIKALDGKADDQTGTLTITRLVFSGANVNGDTNDLDAIATNDSGANPFVYNFPVTKPKTTSLNPIGYVENNNDLFPYEIEDKFKNSDQTIISQLKTIVKNQLIINNPNPSITDDEIDISFIQANNRLGTIDINVTIKRRLIEGEIKNTPLTQKVTINGFKTLNHTVINRNLNYPQDIYPSDIENYFANNKINNDQDKILTFFDFHNLPKISYDSNGKLNSNLLTNFQITNLNNLNGTATISFVLNGGYFNDDDWATLIKSPLNCSLDFNLFKFAKPTKLNDVTLLVVDKWLTSEFVKELQNNTIENVNILKSAIFNSCENPPEDVSIDTYLNWITLGECSQVSDVNKSFKIEVTINKYVDENGVPQDKKFTTSILVNGNFRSVENTRFKNYPVDNDATIKIDGVSDIKASSWVNETVKIKNAIISKWESLIKGDIPPDFNIENNLIIKTDQIKYDDKAGYIDVPVSLKTYYDGGHLVEGDQDGYDEDTIIHITGFHTIANTEIPDTKEKPYNISDVSKVLPSESFLKFTEEQWKQLIINNVLIGGTDGIATKDITKFQINRVDDKYGVVSCEFKLNSYYLDGEFIEVAKNANKKPLEATNLFIGGFKTQTPSSLKQDLTYNLPNVNNILPSVYFEQNKNEKYWQQYFFNQGIVKDPTPNNDYLNINLNMSNVNVNDKDGTITFNKIELNSYFAKAFGFNTSNGNFNISKLPDFQEDFTEYPYPTTLTTPNLDVDKLSPYTKITIKGFNHVNGPTTFIDDSSIDYDQSSSLVSDRYSTNKLVKFLSNNLDDSKTNYIPNFKSFIFDNCITGEKQGIDKNNDIAFEFSDNASDIENGTITATISLNKYWSNDGTLKDKSKGDEPLRKTITFNKFASYQSTKVIDNQEIKSQDIGANISTLYANQLLDKISNQADNKPIIDAIKWSIINKCLSGNKANPVNNLDNITIIEAKNPNFKEGSINIYFKLKQIWDITDQDFDGKNPQNGNNKEYNITITQLKTLKKTEINSPLDINKLYINAQTYDKFQVLNKEITAEKFLTDGYKIGNYELSFEEAIRTLFEQNKGGILKNIDRDKLDAVTIVDEQPIIGKISDINPNELIVTITLSNTYDWNEQGNNLVEGNHDFDLTLYNFFQKATGPTKIKLDPNYTLSAGNLFDYVYSSKPVIYAETFEDQILKDKNSTALAYLSEFVYDNCLDPNSNLDGIQKESSFGFEYYPNSQTNSFDRKLYIRFWLKDYNDKDGNQVSNATYEQAINAGMYRDIIISNFPKPENTLKQPTLPLGNGKRVSIKAKPVYVGPDKKEDNTLPTLTVKDLVSNLDGDENYNTKLFKAWIMQNLYTGNTTGLVNYQIEDGKNVNITVDSPNYQDGEITITVTLKNYWTENGIGNNGCVAKNICIYDFKKINSTKITNLTLDLVNEANYPLASNSDIKKSNITSWATSSPDYSEVFNEIKSKRVSDFINNTTNTEFKAKAFNYIKQWMVQNKDIVFSYLPEDMSDQELFDNIIIDNKSPWLPDHDNGTLTVFFSLNKYLKDDGTVAQTPDSNPLVCKIKFSGFQMTGTATHLQNKYSISVTQTNSLPYFITSSKGINYSDLASSDLLESNNLLSLTNANVIRRMILATPNGEEKSSNYSSLITGNISGGVSSPDNISIDSVQALPTLGKLVIKYHLLRAWTETDVDVPTKYNLSGELTLVNFKKVDSKLQISEKLSPFIFVGVGLGIFIILFLILFVIFYRKRRDIEYQQ